MAALLILTLRERYSGQIGSCDYREKAATCLPVQEREQVQYTQARQEVQVNLGHQLALADRLKLRRLRVRLRVIVLLVAILGWFQLCRRRAKAVSTGLHKTWMSRAAQGRRKIHIRLQGTIPGTPMIGSDRQYTAHVWGRGVCQDEERNNKRKTEVVGFRPFWRRSARNAGMSPISEDGMSCRRISHTTNAQIWGSTRAKKNKHGEKEAKSS